MTKREIGKLAGKVLKFMVGKWVKKSMSHFKNGHEYDIYIKAPSGHRYSYQIHTVFDKTEGIELDYYDDFASLVSIKQCFKIDNLVIDYSD